MRKYLMMGLSVFLFLVGLLVILCGMKIGYSYGSIKQIVVDTQGLQSQLNNMNKADFEKANSNLSEEVKAYEENKKSYDALSANIESTMLIINSDNLKQNITKHAEKNAVVVHYDISASNKMTALSDKYIYCDLKFEVKGEYHNIISFVEEVEEDGFLRFSINDFVMKNNDGVLEATFLVPSVAIER